MKHRVPSLLPIVLALSLSPLLTSPGWSLPISAEPKLSLPVSPAIQQQPADADFTQYTFKTGTAFQILLQTPVNTATNQPGDPVEGIITRNLYLNNTLLLSKNTRFTGIIERLEAPIQGRDAILSIRFTQILMDNGDRLPMAAHVRTDHPEHIWGGLVTRGTKPVLSTQHIWGIGDYNRIVFAGPRAMGSQIAFQPGEQWTIILDQPLTLLKVTDPSSFAP